MWYTLSQYIWEGFQVWYNITWETCFEKSEVMNRFINSFSKSRNRDFCFRKYGEEGDTWCFFYQGRLLNVWEEIFKRVYHNGGHHSYWLHS